MAARVTSEDFLKFQLDNDITVPSNAPIKVLQMGGIVAGGWHVRIAFAFAFPFIKVGLGWLYYSLQTYDL